MKQKIPTIVVCVMLLLATVMLVFLGTVEAYCREQILKTYQSGWLYALWGYEAVTAMALSLASGLYRLGNRKFLTGLAVVVFLITLFAAYKNRLNNTFPVLLILLVIQATGIFVHWFMDRLEKKNAQHQPNR